MSRISLLVAIALLCASAWSAPARESVKTVPPLPLLQNLAKISTQVMNNDFKKVDLKIAKVSDFFTLVEKTHAWSIYRSTGADPPLGEHPEGRMTLAGFLQKIEDTLGDHIFIIRDYGLTLVERDEVPHDALTFGEFRRDYLPLLVSDETPAPGTERSARLRREMRRKIGDAEDRIKITATKRDLLEKRLRQANAPLAKADLERLQQIEREHRAAKAALDRLSVTLREAVAPDGSRRAANNSAKVFPCRRALVMLRASAERELNLEFCDLDTKNKCADDVCLILDKIFRLGVFHEGRKGGKLRMVPHGKLTLLPLIQFLDDSLERHTLVFRDYGLVAMRRDKVPPDGLTFREFRRDYWPFLER